jgi:uncharacterized protein
MSGQLLSNLVAFGRVLRGLGLDASPGRTIDFAHALDHVRLGSRSDVYHAARSLFVSRYDQIPSFDRAFEAFWRKPAEGSTTLDLRAIGEERRFRRPALATAREQVPPGRDDPDAPPPREQPPLLQVRLTQSAREILRHKDFAELTAEELEAVRRLIRGLRWSIAQRRTRRHRPGDGSSVDLRRTLRRNLRHGGEILAWSTRTRTSKPRPLVVLADISGSMEPYTRLLLLFLHALSESVDRPVEAFVFGTRLTRISRQLSGRDPDEVLAAVSKAVPDWSGGTRIGAALREFNFRWGRRVLGSGAAVLLISDGWDRGEPGLLATEMARLQRNSHRVIWLNPLLGSPDYEPLAQGIRAALPFVDDFLPVHSLASLEDLARRLEELPRERPLRRQHPHRQVAV